MGDILRSALGQAIRFEGTVTLALRLPLRGEASAGVDVRELERSELADAFRDSGMSPGSADDHDELCPGRWRCFVATDAGTPVHHAFVSYEPMGPVLYRVATTPSHQGKGLFRHTVGVIASTLAEDSVHALYSKVGTSNTRSIAAHRALGFEVVKVRRNVSVFGWVPREMLSRTLRRFVPRR